MPRRGAPPPPPGAYPRLAGLSDVLRLFAGDRATHGVPPGTHWTWLGFPESWPLVSCDEGNYTGPGTALGSPGDLWWMTLAEVAEHQPDASPAWLDQLLARQAAEFVGPLAAAFIVLGSVPLLWTVPNYPESRMAAYQPHYRLAFGGPLFALEEWSCRLNITSAGDLPTSGEADTMLPTLAGAITTWVTSANSYLSASVGLSWVKFNEVNAAGHYTDPDNSRTMEVTGGVVGDGTAVFPPQVALVVSLLTAHNRGKAHAGRMFTPALAAQVDSTGTIAASKASIASAMTTLLNSINSTVAPAGVSIISPTGEANHVTRVRVGRVFDTMRSRRNKLPENYLLGSLLAE